MIMKRRAFTPQADESVAPLVSVSALNPVATLADPAAACRRIAT